jgi:hypothetical protein
MLEKIGIKIVASLSTLQGWLTGLAVFIADYFAGHAFVCLLVLVVTMMDAIWGIAVSIKRGKFTRSELARQTIVKLAVYGCTLVAFVGLDKMVDTTISASIIGAIIVLVELWSSCASMLILYPHMAFLRLIKEHLIGEIANKLNIPESEVEEVLKDIHSQHPKEDNSL